MVKETFAEVDLLNKLQLGMIMGIVAEENALFNSIGRDNEFVLS
jgi:hypothetical protein